MKALIITAASVLLLAFVMGGCVISPLNRQASLHVAIEAKIKANQAEFDNLKKKISNSAEITDAQMEKLKEIFVAHAEARTSDGGGSLAKWVTESVPNIDSSSYKQLLNIVNASRDAWTARQSELVDMSREENTMFVTFPSNAVLSMFGRKPAEIVIVTSSATKEAFSTGEDNDGTVFKKNTQVEK